MRTLRKHTTSTTETALDRELAYSIAQAVFDLRTQRGWSQGELAQRSGTKQPAISAVENAVTLPTLGKLLRIADALGVRVKVTLEEPGETAQ